MKHSLPIIVGFTLLLILAAGCGEEASPTAPGSSTSASELLRRAAFAGQFYPADAETLAAMVDGYLAGGTPGDDHPLALIVPHAGYIYSGGVAGAAYAAVRGQHYDAVVLIGQNHYIRGFTGVAVYPGGAWETPLGTAPVDAALAQAILEANPAFESDPARHAQDHNLEVQVPFLQRALPGVPIVPILIGYPLPENAPALIAALAQILPGRDVLLVASSDLSHYPAYDDAERVDRVTLAAIASLDADRLRREVGGLMAQGVPNLVTACCGEEAIVVVMETARRLGADRAEVLRYANSGDVPQGERGKVVGYGAVKIWREGR